MPQLNGQYFRLGSSSHADKMPKNESHHQRSGIISRDKWASSQQHARSSQEVPSACSQESKRRKVTWSKSEKRLLSTRTDSRGMPKWTSSFTASGSWLKLKTGG
ncbi:hypothetical protein DFP73DRAFT_601960 [Morchella snyderi]|nr:hypothetical protein DFP73DRAFT_601960 [Morchella snyderi]